MNEKGKDLCYTIEREFLGQISVTELLSRIIRAHIANDGKEASK